MKHVSLRDAPFVVVVLSDRYCAVVDRQSWSHVRRHSWHVHISRGKGRNAGAPYARANISGKKVYLHRFLTNCPEGLHVDHKNHQTLDFRLQNLEVITPTENQRRRRNCKNAKCPTHQRAESREQGASRRDAHSIQRGENPTDKGLEIHA